MADLEYPNDEPGFCDASQAVPDEHPLRRLFQAATRRAFDRFRGLYHPGVETHISEEILSEFVHVDRLHRVRDAEGRQLTGLSEIASEGRLARGEGQGVERDLEIHQHTGDYALFMVGLFPECLEKRRRPDQRPLLACIGSKMISLDNSRDYYIVEGRSAYSHVSTLYGRMGSDRSGLFRRLAHCFEEYLELMSSIRDDLNEAPPLEGEAGFIC